MSTKTILLSAYSCAPNAGSEQAIGWNWAQSIAANGFDVVVITRAVNKRNTGAEYLHLARVHHVEFVFHELSSLLQKLYALPLGNYLYYLLWQYTAARLAAKLHLSKKFDQVHHITWGSFRAPSFMGRLGIPFVFGPVGGGEDTPIGLRRSLGWRGRLWDTLRRTSNSLLSLDPFMRSTYAAASEILVTTPETLDKIPERYRLKVKIQPAAGVDPTLMQRDCAKRRQAARRKSGTALRAVYVGRLLPWKGLHLGLRALAELDRSNADARLTVIGSGQDEARLKRMANTLGIAQCIDWISWLGRAELLHVLPDFDVFLFPSFHDSGGMAVLEALSCGLPVVCLDLGGPSSFIDDSCGCVVSTEAGDENSVVEQIAGFLSEIARDRNKLRNLSEGARRRASSLTWDAHVRTVYGDAPVSHAD
jgi:glycosyltransferase involved in cell wall biosynthesis